MSEPTAPGSNETAAWRRFPQLEKLFEEGRLEPGLRQMEKTCRRLEELAASGSADEKRRAQAALAAYRRTFEMVRSLAEQRNQLAARR